MILRITITTVEIFFLVFKLSDKKIIFFFFYRYCKINVSMKIKVRTDKILSILLLFSKFFLFLIKHSSKKRGRKNEVKIKKIDYRNGSGVCLLIMSVADIASLTTIGIHLVIKKIELSLLARNIICKVNI